MRKAIVFSLMILSMAALSAQDELPESGVPNMITWFEIPTEDMDRACKFYGQILGLEMEAVDMFGQMMAMFPMSMTSVSGALVHNEFSKPGPTGTMVYLNTPEIDDVLSPVVEAGGEIMIPKMEVSPEIGHVAAIKDSEGNIVGLHSVPEAFR